MNLTRRFFLGSKSALTALVIATAGACLLMATADHAEARQRQSTLTGPQGQSAQRSVTRAHGDVSSSTTGPNGKTSSRVVDRSVRNGSASTTATVTGPNGQTATRSVTHSVTHQR